MAQDIRARITVKVQPRAKATRLAGRFGDAYKLQLAAPPVDGKANEECVAFLCGTDESPAGARPHRDRLDKPLESGGN